MNKTMKRKNNIVLLLLVFLSFLIVFPIFMTIIYSFFSPEEIKRFLDSRNRYNDQFMEIKILPHMVSLDQYWMVLVEDNQILKYYFNSLSYALVIISGQIAIIPALAYALSRFSYRGKDVLSFSVIVLLILPIQVTMVPSALMLHHLGLFDTVWAIVLPALVSPFYVFFIRQNMLTIPDELFEAAQLDGAGPIRCFIHIAIPSTRAILGAAVALSFADCWNMVEQPLIYLPNQQSLHPLSVVFNQLSKNPKGIEFAGATIYILPALLIFLFFQDDIVSGIQISDIK